MDGCGGVDLVWENGDGLYLNLDIGRAKSGHLDLCAGRKTCLLYTSPSPRDRG